MGRDVRRHQISRGGGRTHSPWIALCRRPHDARRAPREDLVTESAGYPADSWHPCVNHGGATPPEAPTCFVHWLRQLRGIVHSAPETTCVRVIAGIRGTFPGLCELGLPPMATSGQSSFPTSCSGGLQWVALMLFGGGAGARRPHIRVAPSVKGCSGWTETLRSNHLRGPAGSGYDTRRGHKATAPRSVVRRSERGSEQGVESTNPLRRGADRNVGGPSIRVGGVFPPRIESKRETSKEDFSDLLGVGGLERLPAG